jgi:hypothetical protein
MLELQDQQEFLGGDEMNEPEIEEFAKLVIENIRDAAIRNCDAMLSPISAAPVAKRWRSSGASGKAIGVVIPDAVDEVVFCLLQAIDQGLLQMKFVSSGGKEINLSEDGLGELSGWFMGSGGWRKVYSKERFVDDFSDLGSTP